MTNPPSCFPFRNRLQHDRHDATMHNRDDEKNRQRHSHDTETPQSKPKLDTRPNWKRKKYPHRHERRHIKQTERNQKKIKPNGHLLYPSDGTRPECAVCKFTNKKNHGTHCQHGIKQKPSNYIRVAHFQKNRLSFYRYRTICPKYYHVLDDADASRNFSITSDSMALHAPTIVRQ